MTVAERVLNSTFQRVADWTDARAGLSCFALASHVLTASAVAAVATGCMCAARDRTPETATTLVQSVLIAVPLLLSAAYVRRAQCRMTSPTSPAVIHFLRHWLPVTTWLACLAVTAHLAWGLLAILAEMVAIGGLTHPLVLETILSSVPPLVTLAWPVGTLLACCEWRRRPRVRREPRSRLAMAPG